ncbi:MAG: methyltransferase domain-containing protein [Vicinamibacterales bacterium]
MISLCTRERSTWRCAAGHTFDIARSGYVNLLQPQDRKSREPGDTRESVESRAALLARGVGRETIDAVLDLARVTRVLGEPTVVVELGAGSGEAIGTLSADPGITGVGIDLSSAAATLAARRFPAVTWVVANADRRLPLRDLSVDMVLSINARRNPPECHRILAPHGRLIVAIPAADDLIELRAFVQGAIIARDRVDSLVAEHARWFDVVDRRTVRQQLELDRDSLLQLLSGTYRGSRLSVSARVQALERLTVTLASDVVMFGVREGIRDKGQGIRKEVRGQRSGVGGHDRGEGWRSEQPRCGSRRAPVVHAYGPEARSRKSEAPPRAYRPSPTAHSPQTCLTRPPPVPRLCASILLLRTRGTAC